MILGVPNHQLRFDGRSTYKAANFTSIVSKFTALNIFKIPKPINFVGANPLWLPINRGRHGGATPTTPTLNPKVKSDEDENWLPGIYFPSPLLLTGVIAIDKLANTPETLWLRILGKGIIQQAAINEVIALPEDDRKRYTILKLLGTWKITMEISNEIDVEDRELIMNLTPAYLEWERITELRGLERGKEIGKEIGKEQERRQIVENLLLARFGFIDQQLAAVVQPVLNLTSHEYTTLLLQLSSLSREQLLSRFQ